MLSGSLRRNILERKDHWIERFFEFNFNRFRHMVFVTAMIFLPISEWRLIHYNILGERAFSPFHILFILAFLLFLVDIKKISRRWESKRFILTLTFIPLGLMIVYMLIFPPFGLMITTHGLLFSFFMIFGTLTVLMNVNWEVLSKNLINYLCGMFAFLMIPLIAVITPFFEWWWDIAPPLFSGWFAFPFLHTNHSSFFMLTGIILLLGLFSDKTSSQSLVIRFLAVVFITGAGGLAIAFSGSRTGFGLLILLIPTFLLGYGFWAWVTKQPGKETVMLMGGIIIGILLCVMGILSNSHTKNVDRISLIFGYNLHEVIIGKVDPARYAMWSQVLPDWIYPEGINEKIFKIEGFDALAEIKNGGNLHSIILSLYVWGGIFPAVCLLFFLVLIVFLASKQVYFHWTTPFFPFSWAILLIALEIVVFSYFQPFEYVAPMWVTVAVLLRFLIEDSAKGVKESF